MAAMFYTPQRLNDPLSGRFWTLTPDGHVYPEMLVVPSALGLVGSTGGANMF